MGESDVDATHALALFNHQSGTVFAFPYSVLNTLYGTRFLLRSPDMLNYIHPHTVHTVRACLLHSLHRPCDICLLHQ